MPELNDIENLMNKSRGRQEPLERRYDRSLLLSYQADLQRLVDLSQRENGFMPTVPQIRDFVMEKFSISLAESSIRRHLMLIKRGETLWT